MDAGRPRLFGAAYSVYVRIARMTLIEKGVGHDLVEVDIFAPGGPPAWYAALHPFGKIPAFEHGALRLFETQAICRYVDEAFEGPRLQPLDPIERAVMNQIIGMIDSYAYRALVWDIYVESVSKPKRGETADLDRIAKAIPVAETCLAELSRLKRDGAWLLGEDITLADLFLAPVLAYFTRADVAGPMIDRHAPIKAWWKALRSRESFISTEPSD